MNGETTHLIRPARSQLTNQRTRRSVSTNQGSDDSKSTNEERVRRAVGGDVTTDGLHIIHSTTGNAKCGISSKL